MNSWFLVNLVLMEMCFGDFELDLKRGELRNSQGPVPLEPRAFALLAYMAEQDGRLVDKEELVAKVWEGRIVSDAAISTAIKSVRRALGDNGAQPRWLKTVRGRGVRFDGEVRRQQKALSAATAEAHPAPDQAHPSANRVPAPKSPSMAIFDRPSVLVVGFECVGQDERDSALALGLAQEVRLNLSLWRWFPVIGPEALNYKGPGDIDVLSKATELGAAFVLTGSIRSIGDTVRVNVTLSSTENGNSIWSRHFDGSLENLFDFEEEISRAIVAQIEPEISRANSQRLMQARPSDLSAWHLLLQAAEAARRGGDGYGTPSSNREQITLIHQALEQDPRMARAWAWLSRCHWQETIMGWADDGERALNASLEASQTAMELNPMNWEARSFRALALLFGRREFVESEFHAREAVRLNPSDATARHALGCVIEHLGHVEEALESLQTVLRLNPNYPNTAAVFGDIATCHMLLGQDDKAVEIAQRLLALAPTYSRGTQRAIAALSQAGAMDRAREAVKRLHDLQPDFDEAYVRSTYPFKSAETLEYFVSRLKEAGAFEQALGWD